MRKAMSKPERTLEDIFGKGHDDGSRHRIDSLDFPVADLEISVRSRFCLQRMGIKTLGDLTQATEQELLAHKNFGEHSLAEVNELLTFNGLHLKQPAKEPNENNE